MISINSESAKILAQELESGFTVYVNTESGETKTILNWDDMMNDGYWEDEKKAIEKEWKEYEVVQPPASHDSFEMMETFMLKIKDEAFKKELSFNLNNRKPFSHFKQTVEHSTFREDWFEHKTNWFYNYLVNQLNYQGIKVEEV